MSVEKKHRKSGPSSSIPRRWHKAIVDQQANLEKLRNSELQKISNILKTLEKKYHLNEAYIFGSVAQKGKFRRDSDIDIAIAGLNSLDYYAFAAEISALLDKSVDVVLLEECQFAQSIKQKGLKWSHKTILVFLADFDFQIEQIRNIYRKLRKKKMLIENPEVAQESVESVGYWLHNLYNAYEDLFKLAAGFWENSLNLNGAYHVQLLKRMLVSIDEVRPALLSENSFRILNELRGFRHIFRHAYSYGLEKERVIILLRNVLEQQDPVIKDLQIFCKTVAGYVEE